MPGKTEPVSGTCEISRAPDFPSSAAGRQGIRAFLCKWPIADCRTQKRHPSNWPAHHNGLGQSLRDISAFMVSFLVPAKKCICSLMAEFQFQGGGYKNSLHSCATPACCFTRELFTAPITTVPSNFKVLGVFLHSLPLLASFWVAHREFGVNWRGRAGREGKDEERESLTASFKIAPHGLLRSAYEQGVWSNRIIFISLD